MNETIKNKSTKHSKSSIKISFKVNKNGLQAVQVVHTDAEATFKVHLRRSLNEKFMQFKLNFIANRLGSFAIDDSRD